MKSAIFIKTHAADKEFLRYCLASLKKRAIGFDEIVVLVPKRDAQRFRGFDYLGARKVFVNEGTADGYMNQQVLKCSADQYTEADLITYVDSDCFVNRPFSVDDLCVAGNPVVIHRDYSLAGTGICWKPVTEKALGFEVSDETMCRHPFTFRRETLQRFRQYMLVKHGISLAEYILKQPGRDFSEFNAIGAFIMRFESFLYCLQFAGTETPPVVLTQAWSWGGLSEERIKENEASLALLQ